MNEAGVLEALARILDDLIGGDRQVLTMQTKRSEIPGLDSFAYMNFIAAVEVELGIRYRVAAIESFETMGDLVMETLRLKR